MRLSGVRSIEPDSSAARRKRECETSVNQIPARDLPCLARFRVLEDVCCIWARHARMDGECLLRSCRKTDALHKTAASLGAVKLPADPLVRIAVERRMRVVVAIEHQVSCSAPDVDHAPGAGKVVIVSAN